MAMDDKDPKVLGQQLLLFGNHIHQQQLGPFQLPMSGRQQIKGLRLPSSDHVLWQLMAHWLADAGTMKVKKRVGQCFWCNALVQLRVGGAGSFYQNGGGGAGRLLWTFCHTQLCLLCLGLRSEDGRIARKAHSLTASLKSCASRSRGGVGLDV